MLLALLTTLNAVFPDAVCPRCKGDQMGGHVCSTCLEALQARIMIHSVSGISVHSLFVWNRRVQRLWYGVKFYKRYGPLFLFEQALRQLFPLLDEQTHVWVVHPPFREGRPNVFAPMLNTLCKERGWHYLPNALQFSGEARQDAQHSQASKQERFASSLNRFTLTPEASKKINTEDERPDCVLIFDDILTSGATMSACVAAVKNAVDRNPASATLVRPSIQGLVLMETPAKQILFGEATPEV